MPSEKRKATQQLKVLSEQCQKQRENIVSAAHTYWLYQTDKEKEVLFTEVEKLFNLQNEACDVIQAGLKEIGIEG